MTAVPDLMVTLANGTQVPWTEFRTWSRQRQAKNLTQTEFSEESRAKIGAAHKGRAKSAETRMRMSQSRQGIPRSAETRAKLRDANLGKVLPEETRAKISAAHKGKPRPESQRAKVRAWHQANPNHRGSSRPIMTPTGEFPSIKAAGEWAVANGLVNARNKIEKWLVTHPDQFYYLPKVTK